MNRLSLNPIEDVWSSTEDLLARFDLNPPFDAQMRKLFEEFYEFTRELHYRTDTLSVDDIDNERIVREFVDVMVVGIVLCIKFGIPFEKLQDAMEFVIDKNDAKDAYTHHVVNGMIVRKE